MINSSNFRDGINYEEFNSTLYYNGKCFTGIYKSKIYENGVIKSIKDLDSQLNSLLQNLTSTAIIGTALETLRTQTNTGLESTLNNLKSQTNTNSSSFKNLEFTVSDIQSLYLPSLTKEEIERYIRKIKQYK